ncbi:MAG: hypothetical protein HYT76_09035 [Deltaproteobacteria bacterium]|nr:hypothetical protein [Deltaproteobacteria bacterium]
MKNSNIKIAVLILTALLLGACGSSTRGSGESTTDSDSPSDASTLGAASQDLFGGMGNDQQALHVEGHETSSWDFCADNSAPEGITMSNLVLAGHYGRTSAGYTVDADFECNSSSAATTFKSWAIAEAIIMDCTGGDLSFTGNGIVQFLASEEAMEVSGKVYGTFALPDGTEAKCDIEIGDTFDAKCETETEDGVQPLETGNADNVCSQPE